MMKTLLMLTLLLVSPLLNAHDIDLGAMMMPDPQPSNYYTEDNGRAEQRRHNDEMERRARRMEMRQIRMEQRQFTRDSMLRNR